VKNTKHVLMAAAAAAALSATLFTVQATQAADEPPPPMTFFITSTDQDGNLGGLAGADALCQRLAQAAGSPATRTWHAYLSTQGAGAVNARDRIGNGPWYNAKGMKIADDVADLHGDNDRDSNYMIQETGLDENGNSIPGRLGRAEGEANKHDILTGSNSLGMAFGGDDHTCNNWTSNSADNHGMLGHYDRNGGNNNTSWNAAHNSAGCDMPSLVRTGGAGKLYCFAIN
jgi:hypothetical protein